MKVIDLLNKIANGEEVPEKIEYGDFIYERFKRADNTYNYKNSEGNFFEDDWFISNILDKEVKIIKDTPKEDKKIEKLGAFNIKKFYDDYPETANFILEIFKKQEEIIDKLNGEDNE